MFDNWGIKYYNEIIKRIGVYYEKKNYQFISCFNRCVIVRFCPNGL